MPVQLNFLAKFRDRKNINKQAPPSGWIKFKLNSDAAITYEKNIISSCGQR